VLLDQADAADQEQEEDREHGRDRRGDELPAELQRRESRRAKIEAAKKVLEERARQKAARGRTERETGQPGQAGRQGSIAQAAVEPTLP
jgi:hypothetical protein